jgi:flagellar secretion chaperone FliS
MSDERKNVREEYLEQMVESASPEGLILMLVNGASNYVRRAGIELEKEHLDEVHNCLIKAQNIYLELVLSLDLTAGEFAENLALVYQFIYNLLIEANLDKDKDKIASALKLSEDISDLWRETTEKIKLESQEQKIPISIIDSPIVNVTQTGVYEPGGSTGIIHAKPELIETPARLNITG